MPNTNKAERQRGFAGMPGSGVPGAVRPYFEAPGVQILHGDCRALLAGTTWGSIVTDPPYGVKHDCDYTRFSRVGSQAKSNTHDAIHGDDKPLDPTWLLEMSRNVIIFGANCYNLPVGSLLIWDKRTPLGNKGVMSHAEAAWWNKGHGIYIRQHTWDGFNRASERGTAFHPTQKPVAIMRWILERTKATGPVLDPYMGCGPVLLAALSLGLPVVGIDINERHCATAAVRVQELLNSEHVGRA